MRERGRAGGSRGKISVLRGVRPLLRVCCQGDRPAKIAQADRDAGSRDGELHQRRLRQRLLGERAENSVGIGVLAAPEEAARHRQRRFGGARRKTAGVRRRQRRRDHAFGLVQSSEIDPRVACQRRCVDQRLLAARPRAVLAAGVERGLRVARAAALQERLRQRDRALACVAPIAATREAANRLPQRPFSRRVTALRKLANRRIHATAKPGQLPRRRPRRQRLVPLRFGGVRLVFGSVRLLLRAAQRGRLLPIGRRLFGGPSSRPSCASVSRHRGAGPTRRRQICLGARRPAPPRAARARAVERFHRFDRVDQRLNRHFVQRDTVHRRRFFLAGDQHHVRARRAHRPADERRPAPSPRVVVDHEQRAAMKRVAMKRVIERMSDSRRQHRRRQRAPSRSIAQPSQAPLSPLSFLRPAVPTTTPHAAGTRPSPRTARRSPQRPGAARA